MIASVLPLLGDQDPDEPPGYEATALSASSRNPVKDPPPAEHTEHTERTGPPAGVEAAAAQTTPSPAAPAGYAARPAGAPPDFSSWYDPVSRAAPGPPTPGAGSGAGYPAPIGYGPAPWSGQASQQAPGAPPWSGAGYAPPPRRRSGRGCKAAVAVVAISGAGAGAATVVLLNQNQSGPPQGRNSTSAPPSTPGGTGGTGGTLPPALLTTAINQPLTGPPPAGYKSLSKAATGTESAGFSIDYPTDWTVVQKGTYQTWLYAPQSGVNMLVDLTPHTYPGDMVQEAQYIESQSIPHFPGYQRSDLKALTIRGTQGSFWKFTWTDNGVQQEALDFLFIQDQQSYALYATAPASMWQQMQPVFDEELRSFAPRPK